MQKSLAVETGVVQKNSSPFFNRKAHTSTCECI